MLNPESNQPPKVTLEDLLRLKRHERPAPEYWARFDRELRERALRVMVQPEPWGLRWSRALMARAAPLMMAGATAALAMAFTLHSHMTLPMPERMVTTRVAMAAPTLAPAKAEAASPVVASTPSAPAAASLEANALDGARTQYVVAVLTDSPKPANDHTVSATTMLPSDHTDVRYAADALAPEAMLSRVSGMAY
jgi:hypothetical protein